MAQNCARSVPESLRVNPTNKGAPVGSYFLYSEAGWSDVFGVLTHSGTYEVKQCRDGTQVWSGQVIVWLGTGTNKVPAHGRRDPYSSASVFQTGDDLVPISGSCLQQTPAPVPTPEDSPPPTPAPEDADSVETALGGDGASCALGSDCTGGKCIWFKCTSGKNGQKCIINKDCSSGHCDGTCAAKLSSGSKCTENTDCQSGICFWTKCLQN